MLNEDERMDALLKGAMSAEPPQLSHDFDETVLRRTRPRRLAPVGRLVLAVYAVMGLGLCAWLLRDLPIESIAASIGICAVAAGAASLYVKSLPLSR